MDNIHNPPIGEMVDELYRRRQKRLKLKRELDQMQADENEIKKQIISKLQEAELTGARGEIASITISLDMFPGIADKEEFYRSAVAEGNFHLLMSQVNKAAFREYFELKSACPPGVNMHTDWKVTSLRKIK